MAGHHHIADSDPPPPVRRMTEAERLAQQRLHWDWLHYIVLCGAFGVAVGVAAASFIVHADIGGIGSMLSRSPDAIGYKLLLAGGLASTFGMVSMGVGILIRSEYF